MLTVLLLWFQRELVQQLPVVVCLSRTENDTSPRSERVRERDAAATRHPPSAAGA